MNNISYEELMKKYQQSQHDIEYLNYKIQQLQEEVERWQEAYEEYADLLIERSNEKLNSSSS